MLKTKKLEKSPLNFTIRQQYDYLKIGFASGMPYNTNFEIEISIDDATNIIESLIEGKKELIHSLTDYRKKQS